MKFIHLSDFKKKKDIEPEVKEEVVVEETPVPETLVEHMNDIDQKVEADLVQDIEPEVSEPEVIEPEIQPIPEAQVTPEFLAQIAELAPQYVVPGPAPTFAVTTDDCKVAAIENTLTDIAFTSKDERLIEILCDYAKVSREAVEQAYTEGKSLSEITGKTVILI